MAYRVFISHSSHDTWVAKQIERNAKECGAETFLDAYDIEVGDNFEVKIRDGIKACDELLVLFTRYALESDYVTAEIAMAASKDPPARISPVLYGVELEKAQEKPFVGKTLFVEVNRLDEYFQQLKNRVSEASKIELML